MGRPVATCIFKKTNLMLLGLNSKLKIRTCNLTLNLSGGIACAYFLQYYLQCYLRNSIPPRTQSHCVIAYKENTIPEIELQ